MTWPATQSKANVDSAADDPKLARSDFADNVDKFNLLQAHVSSYIQGLLDDADAAAARATLGIITPQTFKSFTAATTSTFSSLPAGLTRITGNIDGATFGTGTDRFEIRLGDSGGIDATAYIGRASQGTGISHDKGFVLNEENGNANVWDATFELNRREDHIWHFKSMANRNGGLVAVSNGMHVLASALTDVQLTTFGGATMTASGGWNITLE